HGAHFDEAAPLDAGAAGRELGRLVEVAGLDQRVAADDVLRLRIRTVGDRPLLSAHDLAQTLERLPDALQFPLLLELLEPGHPLLHRLLRLLRAQALHVRLAAVQENVFAHLRPPRDYRA